MAGKKNNNTDKDWWKKAVFYQIYPRSFMDSNGDGIGDIPGIISKLDYLNDGTPDSLGIDAIWFSPFFRSPDHDYGYDISDYYDIDPRYGTLEDFDRLVDECHKRNIRVMLDLVVNHTSNEHPWFLESSSSRDNPKRDWYIWCDGRGPDNKPPNNWRNNFFGSAWEWDEHTEQYYLHSFLKEQPDLNWYNPEVKEAIFDVVRFWLDRGADGYRLDVAHHYCKDVLLRDNPPFYFRERVPDKLSWTDRRLEYNLFYLLSLPEFQINRYNKHHPETHYILKEFRRILDSYPGRTSVGEIENEDPRVTASYYGENDELHMNFYFDLMFCRWRADSFRRAIDRWEEILQGDKWPAYTFNNHDQARALSKYDTANRGDKRARLMALALLTFRGTPFLYYGEEIGMKNATLSRHELRDPVGLKWYPVFPGRDGARTPMQWEDRYGGGFTTAMPWLPIGPELDTRNVSVQENDPHSMLSFYKKMIWLRKDWPSLQTGSYRSLTRGVPHNCYMYLRELGQERLIVALNFSDINQKIMLTKEDREFDILITTDSTRMEKTTGNELKLSPLEGCIIKI
ncbi:MAG: alpha-glucosidase [Firmicutes bacterium]|jgi:alpha-glucosidase|nr:alpha-glucosidase [Bacillota bacterium]